MMMTRSLLFVGSVLVATSLVARPESKAIDEDAFVVVMTDEESSAQALFDRYPEMSGSWEELAKFNLLRPGQTITVPRRMLSSDGMLVKIASSYGDVEVKRSFDKRFIPVVDNLLLREGDEIRTWSGSGVRVLFEDGNYVFVNSHTKVRLTSLGETATSGTSKLQVLLREGSIWSQIENKLKGEFEVRTPTSNTIIRGTRFRVKVEPGDATRLEVLEGSVEFEAGGTPVAVSSQQGALANGADAAVTPVALPAPPATLRSPEPQEVIRGADFDQLFRWDSVPGASAYHLVIARDNQFFDVVDERHVGPEASIRIPSLEPGTYFWRVSSIEAGGFEGSFTEIRYFVFVRATR